MTEGKKVFTILILIFSYADPRIQNRCHKTEYGSDAHARREQETGEADVGNERKIRRYRG